MRLENRRWIALSILAANYADLIMAPLSSSTSQAGAEAITPNLQHQLVVEPLNLISGTE